MAEVENAWCELKHVAGGGVGVKKSRGGVENVWWMLMLKTHVSSLAGVRSEYMGESKDLDNHCSLMRRIPVDAKLFDVHPIISC
jgi:hypothetical protein